MTTPPVGEAAERLRAALADVEAGRKAKLFPADVRALLESHDERGGTDKPDKPATQPVPASKVNRDNARLRDLTDSLRGMLAALDKLNQPDFDEGVQAVLVPFARAILCLLNREIDEIEVGAQ